MSGWMIAAALLLALPAAQAQTVLAEKHDAPPAGSVLPPPDINDPGVAQTQSIPLPSKAIPPSVAPAARGSAATDNSNPDVRVHVDAQGNKVEEYRRNGHVYMVRVTPRNGVPQTYYENDNASGSLSHDPQRGPVAPVYYTLFEWGGTHKAAPASSAAGH